VRIAVWKTGHEIADTVAQAVAEGFDGELCDLQNLAAYSKNPNQIIQYYEIDSCLSGIYSQWDVHLAYGILRGADSVFKRIFHWFNIDRGYFNPSHYDGYYRISYKGTQAKYDADFSITSEYHGELQPVRKRTYAGRILICPPTEHVCQFFGIDSEKWLSNARFMAMSDAAANYETRLKGDTRPIDWDNVKAIITFNSSVGWQALINGIPCLSDTTHSVVGSYYNAKSIDEAVELLHSKPRKPLLDFMASHQFTLAEIRQGLAWPLVNYYLTKYSSGLIRAKQLPPQYASTPSGSALKTRFQSNT
jgi:hypothetical protein